MSSGGGGGGLPSQALVRPSSPNVGTVDVSGEQLSQLLNEPSNGASRFLDGPIKTGALSIQQSGGSNGGPGGGRVEDIMAQIRGGGLSGLPFGGFGGLSSNFGSSLLGGGGSQPQYGGGQNLGGMDNGLLNPTYDPPNARNGFGRGFR